MFNTSFSNKTQLKIKIYFFYSAGSDPVQCIFSFEPDPVQQEQWRMSTLFMGFLRTRAASCKHVAQPQLMMGPTNKKLFLL
jgi:hypothetical protein